MVTDTGIKTWTLDCPLCDEPMAVHLAFDVKKHRISVMASRFEPSCGCYDQ